MTNEKICARCQKVINSNPSYELIRITKQTGGAWFHIKALLGFAASIERQVFPFHTREEIASWINEGKNRRPTDD